MKGFAIYRYLELQYIMSVVLSIYIYIINIIINPKQTERQPKTAQQPLNARYFGGSSFGGICALYMAMKYPGAGFLLKSETLCVFFSLKKAT